MSTTTPPARAVDVEVRARAEYLEMPGLRLTVGQASRLFALERDACAALLDSLVGDGFLYRAGDRYARARSGRRDA